MAAALIAPMLAVPGVLPGADAEFAYEMKWDGVRAVVYVENDRVRVMSRSGRDVSVSYPELAGLSETLGPVVLDGEIVALDDGGRPDFGLLQQRMHVAVAAEAARLSNAVPAVFMAFDLLRVDTSSLLSHPYSDRRELLARLELDGPSWQSPPAFHGDGASALDASKQADLEGIVAKRLSSDYRPGARSRDWIKVKNIRTQEVVIGGWRPGQGRRADTIGSLLLGIPGPDGLAYAGHVGTGFTQAMLADLTARLTRDERRTSPFATELPRPHSRDAHWVSPRLVGEVAFSEWTGDAMMRHPSWRGLRPDKVPDDVVRES